MHLDPFGDHITACSRAGVLRSRAIPLEVAMARVCREAGARVATNVFLRDMNLDAAITDARQIEVVANGLPMWNGAQVAVDTTMGSFVCADGSARPGARLTRIRSI